MHHFRNSQRYAQTGVTLLAAGALGAYPKILQEIRFWRIWGLFTLFNLTWNFDEPSARFSGALARIRAAKRRRDAKWEMNVRSKSMLPAPEIQSLNSKTRECHRCEIRKSENQWCEMHWKTLRARLDRLDSWRPSTLATAEVLWWIKKGIATWQRETVKEGGRHKSGQAQAELWARLSSMRLDFKSMSRLVDVLWCVINVATLCNDSCNNICFKLFCLPIGRLASPRLHHCCNCNILLKRSGVLVLVLEMHE